MDSCMFCFPQWHSRPSPVAVVAPSSTSPLLIPVTGNFIFPVSTRTRYCLIPPRPYSLRSEKRQRATTLVSIYNNQNGNGSGRRPNNRSNNRQIAELLQTTGRFFQSPSGQVALWIGLVWLVLTGRIGFIFDSFLFLFAFVTIVPVLAVLAFRWWLSRQLVQGTCPSCGASVTGLKGQNFPCAVCGNTVQGDPSGSFSVKDPATATIDIDATEIDDN